MCKGQYTNLFSTPKSHTDVLFLITAECRYYSSTLVCQLALAVNLIQHRTTWEESFSGGITQIRLNCGHICGGLSLLLTEVERTIFNVVVTMSWAGY